MDVKGSTQKDLQIKHEIGLLGNSIDKVVSRINDLLNRLIPALRTDTPTDGKDKAPEIELVELAAEIRTIRYAAERQITVMDSALDRLEI